MRNLSLILISFFTTIIYSQCNTVISAGRRHNILLKDNRVIETWGNGINGFGALGLGITSNVLIPTPLSSQINISKIFTGAYNSFVIKENGTLWATGDNEDGQLGIGTFGSGNVSNVFVQIGTSADWKTISASSAHTLAIKIDGTLWAWGSNQQGKLGNRSMTSSYVPIQIGTDSDWKAITGGLHYSVALKNNGTLWAWGLNEAVANNPFPTQIFIGGNDWKEISADSAGLHTLLLKNNGTLYVFGRTWSGGMGSLGLGATIFVVINPVQIGTDSDWQSISAGFNNSFAIKTNSTLWGWGQNDLGQLGDGTQIDKLIPTQIGLDTDWLMVSPGSRHTIALKSNRALYSWGDNSEAQLGNGNYNSSITPILINSCTLSKEEFDENKFVIYPNPTKNILHISTKNNNENSLIIIYDITGREVMKTKTSLEETIIDISNLKEGSYLVKNIIGGKIQSKLILKQN